LIKGKADKLDFIRIENVGPLKALVKIAFDVLNVKELMQKL
jgi:hypothetical protein